jgi:hypothetical protein
MAYAKMLNDRDMVVERENAAGDRMERILQAREAVATARTEKATTAYNTAYEAVSKRGVDTSTAKGRLAFADELSKLDPTAGAAMREDANKMKREEVRENRYAARAAGSGGNASDDKGFDKQVMSVIKDMGKFESKEGGKFDATPRLFTLHRAATANYMKADPKLTPTQAAQMALDDVAGYASQGKAAFYSGETDFEKVIAAVDADRLKRFNESKAGANKGVAGAPVPVGDKPAPTVNKPGVIHSIGRMGQLEREEKSGSGLFTPAKAAELAELRRLSERNVYDEMGFDPSAGWQR